MDCKTVTLKIELELNLPQEEAEKIIEAFHNNTNDVILTNSQDEVKKCDVECLEVVEAVLHDDEESISIIWMNIIKILSYAENRVWHHFTTKEETNLNGTYT